MVQDTAQQRIERALESKTRVAEEQLALEQGDLVDFWRKPATKDESGWRGPARVIEPLGRNSDATTPAATVRWQGRDLQVRTQDIRRALVYCVMLIFASWGSRTNDSGDPLWVITAFVDGLMKGQAVRIGWVRSDATDGVGTPKGVANTRRGVVDGARTPKGVAGTVRNSKSAEWLRAKASAQHSELLLAVLYIAAAYFSLCGCVGARLGRAVASVEGILECKYTFIWGWLTDRPQEYWYYQSE